MLDVATAKKELQETSLLDIERATATTWAGRAAACYQLAAEAKAESTRVQRLQEAVSYRQEALEHAAMTEDLAFLKDVLQEILRYETEAGASVPHAHPRSVQRPTRPT